MQAEANQLFINLINRHTSEIAVDFAIAFWCNLSGPATQSCSTYRTDALPSRPARGPNFVALKICRLFIIGVGFTGTIVLPSAAAVMWKWHFKWILKGENVKSEVLSSEKSRSPARVIKVSKTRHNTQTKLQNQTSINSVPRKYQTEQLKTAPTLTHVWSNWNIDTIEIS